MSELTNADRIAEEARNLTNYDSELRDAHGDPVAELDSMTVFADLGGHEINEIAAQIDGVTRDEVSEWMHEQARGLENTWRDADPIVVLHD